MFIHVLKLTPFYVWSHSASHRCFLLLKLSNLFTASGSFCLTPDGDGSDNSIGGVLLWVPHLSSSPQSSSLITWHVHPSPHHHFDLYTVTEEIIVFIFQYWKNHFSKCWFVVSSSKRQIWPFHIGQAYCILYLSSCMYSMFWIQCAQERNTTKNHSILSFISLVIICLSYS